MIRKIPFRIAANSMLFILVTMLLFHFLILSQYIPYQYVWGGKLNSLEQMQQFETISILINFFMLFIISIKAGYIKHLPAKKLTSVLLWLMILLFVLNTAGNLLAETSLETAIFTPLTLISAILCWRLAIEQT